MSRVRTGIVALALALLGGCRHAGTTPQQPPAAPPTLDVVTLNLYHDRADWPKRMPLVVEGLRTLDPDVIVLQEVLQRETLPNQARTLGEALGYAVHFVSVDPEDRAHRYGNAILTRRPVLARGGQALEPREDSRVVAHVRIDVDGTPLNVYGTHLHHTDAGGAIRERQLREVLGHIDATADGAPSLLAGDFNSTVASPELQALFPRFVDAYGQAHPKAEAGAEAVTTLNPAFFATDHRRIDHVFVEAGRFDVVESRIVLDAPAADGTWPSDHFGLFVRLRLRP